MIKIQLMKKLFLRSTNVIGSLRNMQATAFKRLFLALILCSFGNAAFAQVTVTQGTGGTNICPNLAATGSAPAYTPVNAIQVTETSAADLSNGANTLVLNPPTGWQFNTSVTPTYTFIPGRNITSITSVYSSGTLVITVNCTGAGLFDAFNISNLRVQATTTGSAAGYIYSSSTGIPGITTSPTGTNFADVSLAAAIVPAVSVSASPSTSVCAGTNVTFTPTPTNGGGSPSYQWFVNGSFVLSGSVYSSSVLNNGDNVTTTMTSSIACPTPTTATSTPVTMTINALPTIVTISGGGTVCGSTTLTASNGGSGTIYFQGTTSNGTSTAFPSTSEFINTPGTYYFRAQSGAGCWGPQGSVTVTINPLPNTVTVTGGGTFCGGSTTLNAANGGSGTIYYQGTTSGGTSTATPSTSQSISSSGTYYFRARSGAGCWGVEGSDVVTINPLPTAFSVTGGGSYCFGGTGVAVGLSSSTSGVNYQLFIGGVPTGGTVAGTGSAISFGNQTAAGTYTVVGTNGITGCVNNMTGSVIVTINPLPAAFSVTGGGAYCAGGTGVAVGLGGSVSGTSYQLFLGASPVGSAVAGTGSAITFGLQTTAGTYTVVATITATGCVNNMTGSAVVTIDPLPTAFNVTGGGSYCSGGTGVAVGLSNSTAGVNYQLFIGAFPVGLPVAGIGGAISFGNQTTAGSYTVVATNAITGCTNNMTGSVVVSINPLPSVFSVTGGGGYCSGGTGVHIGLSSSTAGVNYQLYFGATPTGAPVAGTNLPLDFGVFIAVGTYTVSATNAFTGCFNNMSSSATVTVNPLPTAYPVTGGGSFCIGGAGVVVGLASSDIGTSYQLYNGVTATGSPVSGTGGAINFGLQTAAGTYTVLATNTITFCASNMTGSVVVVVDPLPTVYNVTGGGSYCAGGVGVSVGLNGSDMGVDYQLFRGVTPLGVLSGTGGALDFGLQTSAGTYTIVATNLATTCTNNMSGSAVVIVNPLPSAFIVTGGGAYCAGDPGVSVGLSGSTLGINYQLYNGMLPVGGPVAGTGAALDFGLQLTPGSYTVQATNTTTFCTNSMTGSAIVVLNPLPVTFSVTGGGSYCAGGAGVVVGLGGSQVGVFYQLYNGILPIAGPVAGTGAPLNFGPQTLAGTYTVVATDAFTGCVNNMTGSATVIMNPLPATFVVTGGGSYCSGGTGVVVGLTGSAVGINYQLFVGASPVGGAVAGTGAALNFGLQTIGGTYTVVATDAATLCTNNMTGSAVVVVNPLPAAFAVTGGGGYCAGGTGVSVGLSGSAVGINYQLFNLFSPVGAPMAGTGAALDFGLQTTAGFYTVVATDALTGCTSNMTGGVAVTILPLPFAYTVTGGGSYCAGGVGVSVGLSASDFGIDYQLYRGVTPVGAPLAGNGIALDFGLQTVAGIYTIQATDASSFCTNNMAGSATVIMNPLPGTFAVTGGGTQCVGGPGLPVGLSGSAAGINYQLYLGGLPTGAPVAGTGAAITFGLQTMAGTYTVVATDAVTGCVNNMTGSVAIILNPLPTVYAMTGGGSYCSGGTGVSVGLASSDLGIDYELYLGGVPTGNILAGTGIALDFGLQTAAGGYTVVATNTATTCVNNMSGVAVVIINPLPSIYSVTGGGSYCAGDAGVSVGLSNSDLGINYQLYIGGVPTGAPLAGVGGALDFGLQTGAGTYTVIATNSITGCVENMAGSVLVVINPLPTAYPVTGGGSYCTGGAGFNVGLATSDIGIDYELYFNGVPTGTILSGTGAALDFGVYTAAGTYTVMGVSTATLCDNTMAGSAVIIVNPLPIAYTVSGGGSYCAGGSGVNLILSNSEVGVDYQVYVGASPVGAPVAGTGTMLNMLVTAPGIYTIVAVNATTGCTNTMSGSAVVIVNPLPAPITGSPNVCEGSTTSLANATPGGVWSSNDVTIATIDAFGTVSGIMAGVTDISYTLPTGCYMIQSETVNPLPVVAAITGSSNVCEGFTTTFADVTAGGVWTSSNPAVAFVDAFGNITGIAAGTADITYTVTSGFGCVTFVTAPITVDPSPVVSVISGPNTVCEGLTITLANSTPGGVWSSTNTSSATISTGGVVTGVAFGSTVISYTVTNSFGCSVAATQAVNVGNVMPASAMVPGTSATLCHGNPVNLTVVTAGSGLGYQWSVGGTPISGAMSDNYIASTPGFYTVTLDNSTCQVTLPGVNVIASPMPVIALDTAAPLLYTGSFSAYQWFKDGSPITGATSGIIAYGNIPGTYRVLVTDGNGCSDTSAVYIVPGDTTIGTAVGNIISAKDIKVYPNPVSSVLHIDAPAKVFVTILSADGKVYINHQEAISINVSDLADGMYLIQVYDENNTLVKTDKFVKIQ